MIRRPPRSTLDRSSAASDVYKRQVLDVRDVVYAAHHLFLPTAGACLGRGQLSDPAFPGRSRPGQPSGKGAPVIRVASTLSLIHILTLPTSDLV